MDSSRAADAYGCFPGHDIEIADAEQAHIQADLKGTETWVCLPPEARTPEMNALGYGRPVVRLRTALYGHPHSGTLWEDHCDKHARKVGVTPTRDTLNSCYYHTKLQLFLMIYVDDFKLAGPNTQLEIGMEALA